ncbi:hypothetical protein FNH22_24150 [Fulvivirga sp. M361]|uniref:hypothetical protein n=1 Tax=Fulvivirga sp. M361 TaxID=2594266 RepID=UPI001179E8AC|nr:hypothetical protein [Fulvivirga sp. M361]TRX51386.1 hypothetical protein FNH22_24150 [Fulvivirga sp. M361]
MFSENEIATMIEIEEILNATVKTKEKFIREEANFLDISNHDFLSLIMMTPAMGVALANGSISLFEELALNKMARKMSKGGYFLKADPVAHAMKFVINNFSTWEQEFLSVVEVCMECTFNREKLSEDDGHKLGDPIKDFARDLMTVPYIFVRFLSTMVLNDESDIVEHRSISTVEYEKIKDIGVRLKLQDIPVFKSFCNTFDVK